MALDPEIFDTYKAYKSGTAKLVTWLATEARKTQLVDDLFPKPLPKAGTGRLKGKARTAQKAKDKTPNQTYQIRSADLVRMAKAIVDKKAETVPETLIKTITEVIAARRECTEFFEQSGAADPTVQSSNATHRHFISVLEETHRILKPLCKDMNQEISHSAKCSKNQANMESQIPELENLFEYLEVDEPNEWSSNRMPKIHKEIAKSTYELQLTDEDVSFAIYCLLKDMSDIRHHVRTTWAEYREGQIAFTSAALVMNTAISIFRKLNDDFLVNFPEFDDHGELICYLYDGYCDPQGNNDKVFGTYSGKGFKLSSTSFFCHSTYEGIAGFFMEGQLPFFQEDNAESHWTPDEIVLFKCLSLFGLISLKTKGSFFDDQILKGLYLIKQDCIVYTWVVFAVQLLVDTRRVVGAQHLDRCLNETHQLQQWMSKTIGDSLEFGLTNNVNDVYKQSDTLAKMSNVFEKILGDDFVQNVLDESFEERAHLYSWGPFFLFKNHPMILGLIAQEFLNTVHRNGVGLTGDQAAVITTTYLYNAVSKSENIDEWLDLEKLIEWQTPARIFLGGRPDTVAQSDRRGKGTFNFAKYGQPQALKKNRRLRIMSQYVELGTIPGNNKVGQPRWLESRAAHEPLVMLESVVAKHLEKQMEAASDPLTKRRQHPKIDPLKMLSIFGELVKAEEQILRFDLFNLNQRCIELLRAIQKICVEQSPMDYPADEWGGDRKINACFSHMIAGVLGLERYQPTRFPEACSLVKEMISDFGDIEFQKAKSRCFLRDGPKEKVVDNFEVSVEDITLPSERANLFGLSMTVNSDG